MGDVRVMLLLLLICRLCHVASAFDTNPPGYGAETNPTGDPIGGGKGYRRIVQSGNYTVATKEELLSALEKAKPGETVYVAPGAEIDLTGHVGTAIPDGVTLGGNRGADSPSPLIHTTSLPKSRGLFIARSHARITGLRIKGPDCDFPQIDYDKVPRSWAKAITARGENIEVDNCEISNFHHSGVSVQGRNVHVHHNHIHDVHAYPVVTADKARMPMLIEANEIHWIWHTIAGTGGPETGYEARFNLCIREQPPASWGEKHKSHGFDMHAYRPVSRATKRRIAGDVILIHHNTMRNNGPALGALIRGIPRDICRVYRNWFSNPDPALAVGQLEPHANVWVTDNAHGPEKKVVAMGTPTTAQIRFKQPPPPAAEPAVVSGPLPLDIEVNVPEGLTLKQVVVTVGDKEIYSGGKAPAPKQVVVDTGTLGKGDHIVRVTATDNRDVKAQHETTVRIEE